MIRVLVILLLVLLCVSCTRRRLPTKTVVVTDTTIVTTVIRDTILYAPSAQVHISIPIDSIGEGKSANSNQARLSVGRSGDTVVVECICDTVAVEAALRDTWSHQIRETSAREVEVERVKYVPGYIKTLAWIGGAGILLISILTLKKLW